MRWRSLIVPVLFLLSLTLWLSSQAAEAIAPLRVVNVPQVGTFQGHYFRSSDKIIEFLGIRYAEPPVGRQRWVAPTATKSADANGSVFEANEMVACVQLPNLVVNTNTTMSEDCLRLNIWVPAQNLAPGAQQDKPKKSPVLVFIHGGYWQSGSGLDNYIHPEALVNDQGLILVTMNYRLGPMGFMAHPALTRRQPGAPTNFGLLDQRLALKWIYDNIEYFGGDREQITISGESAGASSVINHVMSPGSFEPRYFHRAIALSTAIYIPTVDLKDAEDVGREYATRVGCGVAGEDESSLEQELQCLESKSVQELALPRHRNVLLHTVPVRMLFPVNDGVNFVIHPTELLQGGGKFADVDILFGTVKDEGTMFSFFAFPVMAPTENMYENWVKRAFGPFEREGLVDTLLHKIYPASNFLNSSNLPHTTTAMAELGTDCVFLCPARQLMTAMTMQRLRANSTSRIFGFVFAPEKYDFPVQYQLGISHASDLHFLFGYAAPGLSGTLLTGFSEPDQSLGREYRASIGNFVRTGDPSTKLFKWEPFSASTRQWFVLESIENARMTQFKQEKCDFWEATFPEGGIPRLVVGDLFYDEPSLSRALNIWVLKGIVLLLAYKPLLQRYMIPFGLALLFLIIVVIRYRRRHQINAKTSPHKKSKVA